jgi:plasmid stability protein
MSVAITIRNVSDEVRDELAARAARSGRSLQEYLLGQLTALASRPSTDDVIARARSRVRVSGNRLDPSDILADRDADRR